DGAVTAGDVHFLNRGTFTLTGAYHAQSTALYRELQVTLSGPVAALGDTSLDNNTRLTLSPTTVQAATAHDLSLTNGSVLESGADLTVAGLFTWRDNTLRGFAGRGSLTVLSDMTLDGTYTVRDLALINAGHAVWTGGSVNLYGDSSFTNAPGATFDDQ